MAACACTVWQYYDVYVCEVHVGTSIQCVITLCTSAIMAAGNEVGPFMALEQSILSEQVSGVQHTGCGR